MFKGGFSSWPSCRGAARAEGEWSSGVTNLPPGSFLGSKCSYERWNRFVKTCSMVQKFDLGKKKKSPNRINPRHGVKQPCLWVSAEENSVFSFPDAYFSLYFAVSYGLNHIKLSKSTLERGVLICFPKQYISVRLKGLLFFFSFSFFIESLPREF